MFPVLRPFVKAFSDIAPILCEMFSDGAVLFVTDLNKFINIQNSKEFQMPQLKVGDGFKEDSTAGAVIKTKEPFSTESDASVYGVPVLSVCHAIIDGSSGELVGTFGLVIPKLAAVNLRDMSEKLEESLTEIAATIIELAASSSVIHVNEQDLNKSISDITVLAQKINEVSAFIKEIADEAKIIDKSL